MPQKIRKVMRGSDLSQALVDYLAADEQIEKGVDYVVSIEPRTAVKPECTVRWNAEDVKSILQAFAVETGQHQGFTDPKVYLTVTEPRVEHGETYPGTVTAIVHFYGKIPHAFE